MEIAPLEDTHESFRVICAVGGNGTLRGPNEVYPGQGMFTRGIYGYELSGNFNFMKKVHNIRRWRVVHHVMVVNTAGLFDGFT